MTSQKVAQYRCLGRGMLEGEMAQGVGGGLVVGKGHEEEENSGRGG